MGNFNKFGKERDSRGLAVIGLVVGGNLAVAIVMMVHDRCTRRRVLSADRPVKCHFSQLVIVSFCSNCFKRQDG